MFEWEDLQRWAQTASEAETEAVRHALETGGLIAMLSALRAALSGPALQPDPDAARTATVLNVAFWQLHGCALNPENPAHRLLLEDLSAHLPEDERRWAAVVGAEIPALLLGDLDCPKEPARRLEWAGDLLLGLETMHELLRLEPTQLGAARLLCWIGERSRRHGRRVFEVELPEPRYEQLHALLGRSDAWVHGHEGAQLVLLSGRAYTPGGEDVALFDGTAHHLPPDSWLCDPERAERYDAARHGGASPVQAVRHV